MRERRGAEKREREREREREKRLYDAGLKLKCRIMHIQLPIDWTPNNTPSTKYPTV